MYEFALCSTITNTHYHSVLGFFNYVQLVVKYAHAPLGISKGNFLRSLIDVISILKCNVPNFI